MFEKLKRFLADDALYYSLLLILVGTVAFGLGKNSVMSENASTNTAAITLSETATPDASVTEDTEDKTGTLVGSKNGTKYHFLWCPGAGQIKETNKVFFRDEKAAIAAGYSKAANCPGL